MKHDRKKICIVGAGFTGLSAAFELSAAGHHVTLFEKESDIGGLAGTCEIRPGVRVEKFYHHWFTSDTDVLTLIDQLGLGHLKRYVNSNTGLYYANSIFRLTRPLDLLTFTPIPLLDRIRTGLMALRARRIEDWRPLEALSAEEWLLKLGGRRAYEVIWKPLMQGKFGAEAAHVSAVWMWNKLKLRGSSRDTKGAESLVYFGGGFGALTDGIRAALTERGVVIKTSCGVRRICTRDGAAVGIESDAGVSPADEVLVTLPIPQFLEIAPELPRDYQQRCQEIRYLGNSCLILRLNRSLSSTYWLNVADPTFPFVGIIEHTNLDAPANYGGDHIVYLSKYLSTSDPLFSLPPDEYYAYCEPFIKKIFPSFSREWVLSHHLWKAHYSQPVITRHYSKLIPAESTPIRNLWLSTMAQIYPEDRGTNYAVRYGRRIAQRMIASWETAGIDRGAMPLESESAPDVTPLHLKST
jgi:protoporphyrinogen oxidase